MDSDKRPSVVPPICAHLAGIEVVGSLEKSSSKRPDHFAVVYVDDKEVAKSVKKPAVPAPQWKWQEGCQFWFQPSSIIKIMIYREGRTRIIKHLVGEHTTKVTELLETDATIDLQAKEKSGTGTVAPRIKINLSLVSGPDSEDNFNSLMKTVDANVLRLDNTGVPSSIKTLGRVLQLTKSIMDIVGDAHPVLKASWSVMYSAYGAVQGVELLDDSIRELAESLRESLGIAKEYPDLLVIKGTTNVIEETGRASMKAASLIHEYTKLPLISRALKTQLSGDMKSSIAQCHTSLEILRKQFIARGIINMNHQGARMEAAIEEIDTKIQRTMETIKDDQLAEKIYRWLSAPDSSKNYNEAREKQQRNTCSWFLDGMRFRELQETPGDLLWIKGTAGCGKTILCSSIIEKIIELHKENASVAHAYFFFDGRDSQKDLQLHDKLLRSLISQLSRQCDGIPTALVELYGHGEQQPSSRSLQDTLHRIIDGLPSTYVIIDSLDECIEREKTLQWIEQIVSHKIGNLHMVVASRPERDITDILQPLDPGCMDLATEITPDITIYLEQELSLVKKWDEGMREIIKSTLTMRAQGMFRWVALQLTELKKCSNEDSVKKQLDNLPKGLNEAYDQILLKFKGQTDRNDTKTFLMWLSFSTRPMTLAEIAEAIVVDLDTENGPRYIRSRRYWDKRDVLEKCSGLIAESEGVII